MSIRISDNVTSRAPGGYEKGDSLRFTVFDEDYVTQDDELGTVVLSSDDFHEHGFLGELRLSGDKEAFLKVQISNAEGVFVQGVHQEKDQERHIFRGL